MKKALAFVTDFSLGESSLTIKDVEKIISENGIKAALLADNRLSGAIAFYKGVKGLGAKPVIGLRVKDNEIGLEYLFVAKNWNGYSTLCRLESGIISIQQAKSDKNVKTFLTDIEKISEDALAYGAFSSGDKARDKILSDMGVNVLPFPLVRGLNEEGFYKMASLKAIIEKDSVQNILAYRELSYADLNTALESGESLYETLRDCEDNYHFGNPVPPDYKFATEVAKQILRKEYKNHKEAQADLFEALCWAGFKKRFASWFKDNISPEEIELKNKYAARLKYEIDIIKKMKFDGYMLVVWDFIKEAKKDKIPVGPGRGSAAGSLVSYVLGITNLDPIRHTLLFERFLNPERVSLPDIDIDFCQDRREEILEYVRKKYGKGHVAQVITFGSIAAKAAIRDGARIIQAPLWIADKIAKSIEETKLEEEAEKLEKIARSGAMEDLVIRRAKMIEGYRKNLGVHAAGVVISNDKIFSRAPICIVNDTEVVGYEGIYLEDVNLVKYDFLGLKTLSVIDATVREAEEKLGVKIGDVYKKCSDLSDPQVYRLIQSGNVKGLFQIESDGMRELAVRLQPSNFEELTAMLALYRPGPMQAGMLDSFIERKHGREKVSYLFDELEYLLKPILEPTYGLIVYQEQVMQIVQAVAGFSLGEADLVRRAMGKKKPEEMEKIRKDFVERAVKLGHNEHIVAQLFDMIEKFAGYGFNKSHSAAYAFITYVTAYLKANFPDIFMANLMNYEIGSTTADEKIAEYVEECRRMGIEVKKPSILRSGPKFEGSGNGVIEFGLKAIKGVGEGAYTVEEVRKRIGKDDISLDAFLKEGLKDRKKELSSLKKELSKVDRAMGSAMKKLDKLYERAEKMKQKSLLPDDPKVLKVKEEIKSLESKLDELAVQYSEISRKMTEIGAENMEKASKLDKRVLEALFEAGACDGLGYTRKFLVENVKEIALGKLDVLKNAADKEYPKTKLMKMEIDRIGTFFSDPFEGFKKEAGFGILLDKQERTGKNGKYFNITVFVYDYGESGNLVPRIIKMSDFNGKVANVKRGTFARFSFQKRGKYINLLDLHAEKPAPEPAGDKKVYCEQTGGNVAKHIETSRGRIKESENMNSLALLDDNEIAALIIASQEGA